MPLFHEDLATEGHRVTVHGSIAVELDWAMAAAERADYRRDNATLATLYEDAPELGERIRSMWGSEVATSCGGFMELEVLAHHGGVLLCTDADTLLERLDELCLSAPTELALASETDADRDAVLGRLALLRESADVRGRYVALVGDVWASLRDVWESEGRRAVDAAVAARRDQLARGGTWVEMVRHDCVGGDLSQRLVAGLGPGGEVAVLPAFFTHKGLVLDVPGAVVIGVRTDTTGAEARARTALLARRLKTISDPTRLAILDSLRSGPRTVTEIASSFSLAQPTVSNHVKLLRDAGLVANGPDDQRRKLVVQHDVVADLLEHLHSVLSSTP